VDGHARSAIVLISCFVHGQASKEQRSLAEDYSHAYLLTACDAALAEDVATAEALLTANAPWWQNLNDPRQDVMVNLCFDMGWGDGTTACRASTTP
jgi:hypothetical protein